MEEAKISEFKEQDEEDDINIDNEEVDEEVELEMLTEEC